jgi:hypothetical protein
MSALVWRRITPARYTTSDEAWEVRRMGPGLWRVLRWDEERRKWLVVMDQIPTKTQAMARADGLRR